MTGGVGAGMADTSPERIGFIGLGLMGDLDQAGIAKVPRALTGMKED